MFTRMNTRTRAQVFMRAHTRTHTLTPKHTYSHVHSHLQTNRQIFASHVNSQSSPHHTCQSILMMLKLAGWERERKWDQACRGGSLHGGVCVDSLWGKKLRGKAVCVRVWDGGGGGLFSTGVAFLCVGEKWNYTDVPTPTNTPSHTFPPVTLFSPPPYTNTPRFVLLGAHAMDRSR